jgi:predicted dehydrogenase/nucleoside-diphosphate-sugar epimerase
MAPLRAGIVGTGLISEYHVAAVRALDGVELVGVHDVDRERAEARATAWGTRAFESLAALVEAGADVIHVLTPPSAHVTVALEALERGCHLLIEKPLADTVEDARRIAAVAAAKGLEATVDHSLLYDPQVLGAFADVNAGVIGDVVGVDVVRSQRYPPYEGGPLPPHMRDVAYPWRDVGIHGLYLMKALLGEVTGVEAEWRSLGGDRNLAYDEWRALVSLRRGLGHCHLTWNARPLRNELYIHGTRGVLRVDLFAMFRSRRAATPLPKAAERVVNAYADSLRPLAEVPMNAWRFLRKDIQPYQGIRNFIAEFYRRLARGLPPPVALDDAAVLVGWLDTVARAAVTDHAERLARLPRAPRTEYLVTGATGSLGSAVVRRLVDEGRPVRAFVRRVPDHPVDGVHYEVGNLGDPEAVERAVAGAEIVIHAGAALSGSPADHQAATVMGTRNTIDACRRHRVRQLIHISSMSVVDWAGAAAAGTPIDEETPLEPHAEERGAYTRAKLLAEQAVTAAAREGVPVVIIRPGAIFGGGIPLVTPAVARSAGSRWVVLGDGRLAPPLVYIDDVVDAVMAAVARRLGSGEVIQVVDRERLTQAEILAAVTRDGRKPVRIPRSALLVAGALSEYPFRKLGRQSPIGRHRLRAALADAEVESSRAERLLGWRPRVGVREGVRRVTTARAEPTPDQRPGD